MKTQDTTASVALAFTAREESTAVTTTVAWLAHVVGDVSGWNGTPRKGGKKAAIKVARETYGYKSNPDGTPMLNANGNRVKRSAVYNRLALVDRLVDHCLKVEKSWLESMHSAATAPDMAAIRVLFPEYLDKKAIGRPDWIDAKEVTADISESALGLLIEQFAAQLTASAGGDTIESLSYWLDNGVAKPTGPVESVTDALGGDSAGGDGEAKNEAEKTAGDHTETIRQMNFGDVMSFVLANRHNTDAMTDSQIQELAKTLSEIVAGRAAEAEAEKEAA